MTHCEICAILAYQNEHLEACTARYDFIPYITLTWGIKTKVQCVFVGIFAAY